MRGNLEQLLDIFHGAVWDGDLISKHQRNKLKESGLVKHVMGWNIITPKGARYVIELGLADETKHEVGCDGLLSREKEEGLGDTSGMGSIIVSHSLNGERENHDRGRETNC